jgi:hypothetical protein
MLAEERRDTFEMRQFNHAPRDDSHSQVGNCRDRAKRATWAAGRIGFACAAAATVVVLAASAADAKTAPKYTCPGASKVNAALGTTLSTPTRKVNGAVTICTYSSGSNSQAALIRSETGMTAALRTASRSGFDQHGEPTMTVSGLGDSAFSSTIGSGSFTENTIVVEKGSKELLVTAGASLEQVQALAAKLLASL